MLRAPEGGVLEFGILGPLEVWRGGKPLALGGSKQRTLLALLLLHANEVVSTERLIDRLWEDEPPKTASKVLQVYVSQLRKVLEPQNARDPRTLVTKPSGYMIRLEPGQLDLHRFEHLVGNAHRQLDEGAVDVAARKLTLALELWRGEPLADFRYERFAQVEIARLEELRLTALEDRIDADLALGRHTDVVAEVEALATGHPSRERMARLAMLTLYRCGRQAEALHRYREIRQRYLEEMGIEPGSDLQELERAILRQDEALRWTPPGARPIANNIPAQTTTFIGRAAEISRAGELIRESRLVTLVGPAGCGKSRLAVEVAGAVLAGYPHGVWLVELASIDDEVAVPQKIASTLRVKEEAGRELLDTLVAGLRDRKLLLVLDNCEHVIHTCASIVTNILRSCAGVHVLATSREHLSIEGEVSCIVPPLSTPEEEVEPSSDSLQHFEAVQLFADRARASYPEFELSDRNLATVIQICKRLDGMPLAIELAAARTRSMSIDQIAVRINDALGFLTTGSRTASPRHRTLRAAMDWSYEVLSEREKRTLNRLSVFASGFTPSAAEAVCAGEEAPEKDVVEVVSQLVEKSLVAVERRVGEGRYRLLGTIREYAAEKLDEKDLEGTKDRHAAFFLGLAERSEPELRGSNQLDWLQRLDLDHENVRLALDRFGEVGRVEEEMRLAAALWRYCYLRGRYSEGRGWLRAALSRKGASAEAYARALMGAGALSFYLCDYAQGADHCREALDLFRGIGDRRGIATSLTFLGAIARERCDYDRAFALHRESLDVFRELQDEWGSAHSLQMLGFATWLEGDYEAAERWSEESLQTFRGLRDDERATWALMDLGAIAHYLGDNERATNLLERCRSIFEGLGFKEGVAWSLNLLGLVELEKGDRPRAHDMLSRAMALHRELGDRWRLSSALEALAYARGAADPRSSVRILGAAEALRETIGAPIPICERALHRTTTEELRRDLGREGFDASWASGRTISLDEACELIDRPLLEEGVRVGVTAGSLPT